MFGHVNGAKVWFKVLAVPIVILIVIVPPGSHVPEILGVGSVVVGGTVTVM